MKHTGRRQAVKTLLLVGEGDSEEAFLRYLKAIYVSRNSGIAVTIKNAHGKGAGHVIGVATRAAHSAAFDKKVALLDTDQDWNARTQEQAKKAKVIVLASEPCLEASLLRIHQRPVEGLTSEHLKREFRRTFGNPATDPSVYGTHFDRPRLDAAANGIAFVGSLIRLLQLPW